MHMPGGRTPWLRQGYCTGEATDRLAACPWCCMPQFADSIGLPTDEGIFGFKPFAEVWCGEYTHAGPWQILNSLPSHALYMCELWLVPVPGGTFLWLVALAID